MNTMPCQEKPGSAKALIYAETHNHPSVLPHCRCLQQNGFTRVLDAMTSRFLTSLQFEYDFWNYGYYGE